MKRETTMVMTLVLALTAFGVLMVYSATAVGGNPVGLLHRQLIYAAVGLAAFFLLARFDYHRFADGLIYKSITIVSLALLVLVLIPPFGVEVDGARRWMRIGSFQFQPSELAKLALVVWLAVKLTANQAHVRRLFRGFLPPIFVSGVFAGLVFLEKDLGLPVVLMVVALTVMWIAGVHWFYLTGTSVFGALAVGYLIMESPERRERLLAFLDPWAHRDDASFQLVQSFRAFAEGGLLGQGAGAGEQKLYYLFAAHTDFIFSVVGEELGLFGSLAVVAAFGLLLYASFKIAMNAPDLLGSLLASGVAVLITFQAAFIMGVTVGLLPTKGLPLPFVSYGGTSLIVYLALAGILANVGAQRCLDTEDRPNLLPAQRPAIA